MPLTAASATIRNERGWGDGVDNRGFLKGLLGSDLKKGEKERESV